MACRVTGKNLYHCIERDYCGTFTILILAVLELVIGMAIKTLLGITASHLRIPGTKSLLHIKLCLSANVCLRRHQMMDQVNECLRLSLACLLANSYF